MRSNRGFTLIEVLVSLAIFTIIGLATVRQITQFQVTKKIAFTDLDAYSSVRSAIAMMRNDLSQAFHILYDDLGDENRNAIFQNQKVAHTLFDGRKKELVFTSLSHRNYYAGKRECEQTEISYFLSSKGGKVSSLMKRESEILDDDLYQGGPVYTLLDGVTDLEFQYWDERAGRWVDDWSSDGAQYRDRFPLEIKMKLSVQVSENQKLSIDTRFKVGFPNNDAFLVQF